MQNLPAGGRWIKGNGEFVLHFLFAHDPLFIIHYQFICGLWKTMPTSSLILIGI
jgi:hypothetical protein